MSPTNTDRKPPTGLRERKRRETHDRIVAAGLKLFIEQGYDATTLDRIAAAAGISRRTFFYYFKSKEEVLLAREGSGFPQALHTAMLEQSPHGTPLATARECLLGLAPHYETGESIAVDRLLHSTEALRARKNALYVELERILRDAMDQLWPAEEQREAHRAAALIAIGALRLALDDWRRDGRDGTARPVAQYLRHAFSLVESQFPPSA